METETDINAILPNKVSRLISGVISFLNDKDKKLSENTETKGDSK